MRTVDQVTIRAPLERVLQLAADVERWPQILSHYRRVRFVERRNGGGTVEMAAWRPFGPVRYPTWWVSEMTVDGPAWPLVGAAAARLVIGPVFIHGIASRTLAGIKREAEEARR